MQADSPDVRWLGALHSDAPAMPLGSSVMSMLLDNLPAYIVIFDAGMHYLFANQNALRNIFRRPAEQLVGKHLSEVMGRERWAFYEAHLLERMKAGEAVFMEGWYDYENV